MVRGTDGRLSPGVDHGDASSLFSVFGAIQALAVSIVLCWPMLFITAPIGYPDTMGYLDHGNAAVSLLTGTPADAVVAPLSEDADGNPRGVRSALYALYLAAITAFVPMGLVVATVLQTALTLLVVFALLDGWPISRRALAGMFLLAGTVTTLPWMASYAMPDILGAAVVAYYAVLAVRIRDIGWPGRLVLCAIATFATASHYGSLGLAIGLALAVLILCPFFKRLTAATALLAVAPVAAAMGINLMASAIALDETGVIPKRYPILLARAVEDGPAAWYLDEACPEAGYAICPYFETMPRDVYGVLWSEFGINRMTAEEYTQLRQEEMTILWETARAYPLTLAQAFAANTARQLILAGTDKLRPLVPDPDERNGLRVGDPDEWQALAVFDRVTNLGTALLAALCIGGMWLNGLRGPLLLTTLVLGAGLVGNAAIFGGLSVPVDRYNARVIWLLAPLALILLTAKKR